MGQRISFPQTDSTMGVGVVRLDERVLGIAKQLVSKDRTDLNQIMKHKITHTLDLALLLSGEPDQSENRNNTPQAKQVC